MIGQIFDWILKSMRKTEAKVYNEKRFLWKVSPARQKQQHFEMKLIVNKRFFERAGDINIYSKENSLSFPELSPNINIQRTPRKVLVYPLKIHKTAITARFFLLY